MSSIGFIGLGRMGAGMCARLCAAGLPVIVHDVSTDAVRAMAAQGAEAADSALDVAHAAQIVLVSLPTPDIVHEVLLGPNGVADGRAVEIVVDLSTSGPAMAKRLDAGLAANGIASFDAPVSGGVAGARDGRLSLMASGPEASWPQVEPVLSHFGKLFYMGEAPGAGQTMKLINNLLGAVAIAVTAEGMTMGIKAGLDPARMIDVLNQSTGVNSATRDKWPRAVLPRTFDFGFAAALSHKDMRLCVEEAEALGVHLALGAQVRDLLGRVLEEVGPDADFTAMAKVVEADAGLDPERPA
ncbi:NAD(P)-dependent oxidoreductase [Sphingobium lignivorans]|uniref:3-hydroxyisobutyrate dehydrogenase-like beta-hydroxyacid dehydrogenase n=1 Tax=Sphingobium lignivorans TaxID=2735886 RepID=A0ABR6NF42_9SPHN|nr:NAD(P)-dependent oxidoreductase [Sphingobium lignivorans]MBB5985890.1 3-hydroxyisobutyrate dehydrogenase-like beta-hydroxyacid dehydrogenase [Sphingobium lignivorans]